MAKHQISDKEGEKFRREINSLPLDNQEIAARWGKGDTAVSRYKSGRKWPGRKTLNEFNNAFRNNLLELERKNAAAGYQSSDEVSPVDEEDPLRNYPDNPVLLMKKYVAQVEDGLSGIKKAIEAIEAKRAEDPTGAPKEDPTEDPAKDAGEKKINC